MSTDVFIAREEYFSGIYFLPFFNKTNKIWCASLPACDMLHWQIFADRNLPLGDEVRDHTSRSFAIIPWSPPCPLPRAATKDRKSKRPSPRGCAGWREGHGQKDCGGRLGPRRAGWQRSGWGAPSCCPGRFAFGHLRRSRRGGSGDCGPEARPPRGRSVGRWDSKLSCVAGFTSRAHLSSEAFAGRMGGVIVRVFLN